MFLWRQFIFPPGFISPVQQADERRRISAGVRKSRHFLGRLLSIHITRLISFCVTWVKFLLLGEPRVQCHGAPLSSWLVGPMHSAAAHPLTNQAKVALGS